MTDVQPRRRRALPWLISALIVIALIVVAWFAGEWIAKQFVTKTIRDQIVTQLALPADQDVHVEVAGVVIPQLIAGRLDDVRVSSDDVPLGDITGDISVHATGVQFRGTPGAADATATVGLDQAQVRALMSNVDGFPADTLGLAAPNVTMTTELSVFGARIPVGVALTPGAHAGQLTLTPASFTLGDTTVTADDLRRRFGSLAGGALQDWDVCIAGDLPKGVTLTSASVRADRLVAHFDVDGGIAADPSLQAKGTCA
jgi:hypothetical protein